jgi:hypothetical protein
MVYNEKEKVGSKFDDIAEILPCSIEMVLIDEKVGDCLQFCFVSFLMHLSQVLLKWYWLMRR